MTAVLRENFEIANLLLKNNLATKGYVNREGRDVRQIAVDSNRVRALAYLDNREIPRKAFGREKSVDSVVVKIPAQPHVQSMSSRGAQLYSQRKTSTDPHSSSTNKNDIFGNSYGLKMHQQSDNPIKSKEVGIEGHEEVKKGTPIRAKARGLMPMSKEKNIESNKQIYSDRLDMDSNSGLTASQNSSSHTGLRELPSPVKRPARAPKMPMLDLSN